MALINLATLWKPKKKGGRLKLVGDSKDKQHTYMIFERKSKDGKWTMYDLCEQVDDGSPEAAETSPEEQPEEEDDMPF